MIDFKFSINDYPCTDYVIKPEHGIVAKEEIAAHERIPLNKDWKNDLVIVAQSFLPDCPMMIKAVAKCADGDEWNEKTGTRLVDQKLSLKKHKRYAKQAEHIAKMFQELAVDLQEVAVKHRAKADVIEKDIDKYFRGKVD